MSCKLFAHDLADELLSNWRLGQRQMGLQRIVDEGLIPLSPLLGLSLEAPENRVIKIDGDARLPGRGNHGSALALGEVIHLSHKPVAPLGRPFAQRSLVPRHPEAYEQQPSAPRTRSCR